MALGLMTCTEISSATKTTIVDSLQKKEGLPRVIMTDEETSDKKGIIMQGATSIYIKIFLLLRNAIMLIDGLFFKM
uniref:Uncharacterized protein n=1 Tax=Onchocerca volvulus TaxID=6282 RepID=A0A8R1U2R9_ONCVO